MSTSYQTSTAKTEQLEVNFDADDPACTSAASIEAEQVLFERAFPAYAATHALDELRAREYSRLDRLGHIYLDYTGGSLYAERQLRSHLGLLSEGVFGNPHSTNPTSEAMTSLVERARAYVLDFFNASPDEYAVIFTPNASGALRLVGEAYPFGAGSRYLLTFDNHNSVNGIREFARAKGAEVAYVPVTPEELRVDAARLRAEWAAARTSEPNLFAYPAQSNFSGVQHPLEWIGEAQAEGWDVLLDAAAFAPTNRLDLGLWKPDFVALSFYKLFGYPTGVGCLVAKREKLARLRRPWFAGGTITMASVQGDGHFLEEGEAGFEDGTVDYLNLPAVEIGLRHLTEIGMETIHERVRCLTGWLLGQLQLLRHANGCPLVRLYGPAGTKRRGGTVTFNLLDDAGRFLDFHQVEADANRERISLRTGCFCNPGAGEVANGLTAEDMAPCFRSGEPMNFEQFLRHMDGKATGAIRVSVGIASNFADVHRFVTFARRYVV